ncbi:MAG: hypothetical protein NDI61_14740 [Bdellovibrionaceae bacterium]|nr:hypothetical protein [Pseudobdellovibrionaceae bacterium]
MQTLIRRLQRHARRWWYAPLVAFLAFADHFTIIIPTDGLLVSAVLLNPKRWVSTMLTVTIGSSLGALALAALIEWHGLPLLLKISPGIDQTQVWVWTEQFMSEYGMLAVFAVALSPFMQHPAVALASLANVPLLKIFGIVLLGRIIKYGVVCWVASHMPHLLKRLWGMREEIEEVTEVMPNTEMNKTESRRRFM